MTHVDLFCKILVECGITDLDEQAELTLKAATLLLAARLSGVQKCDIIFQALADMLRSPEYHALAEQERSNTRLAAMPTMGRPS